MVTAKTITAVVRICLTDENQRSDSNTMRIRVGYYELLYHQWPIGPFKMLGVDVKWVTCEIGISWNMMILVPLTTTWADADLARFLQLREIVYIWGWCSRIFSLWIWLLGALRLQKVLPDWKNVASWRSSIAQQPWKRATNRFDQWVASILFGQDQWLSVHWGDS